MKDYTDLINRLNEYSASKEFHGGISAEAADEIGQLMREREALLKAIEGNCEHCAKQYECEYFNSFEFPQAGECEWKWDEDY